MKETTYRRKRWRCSSTVVGCDKQRLDRNGQDYRNHQSCNNNDSKMQCNFGTPREPLEALDSPPETPEHARQQDLRDNVQSLQRNVSWQTNGLIEGSMSWRKVCGIRHHDPLGAEAGANSGKDPYNTSTQEHGRVRRKSNAVTAAAAELTTVLSYSNAMMHQYHVF